MVMFLLVLLHAIWNKKIIEVIIPVLHSKGLRINLFAPKILVYDFLCYCYSYILFRKRIHFYFITKFENLQTNHDISFIYSIYYAAYTLNTKYIALSWEIRQAENVFGNCTDVAKRVLKIEWHCGKIIKIMM